MNNRTRGIIENELRKKRNKKCCYAKELLGIDCSNKIIKAHTLSKSGSLKSIMNNQGKVMGSNISFDSLYKHGQFKLKEFGINEASTFSGFCSEHDKILFSKIEDEALIPTFEQMFLLSFRGLCREIYTKSNEGDYESQKKILQSNLTFALSHEYNSWIEALEYYNKRVEFCLSELFDTYNKMKEILDKKTFHKLEYYLIKLNYPAKVLTSGCIIPDITFSNEKLFDLEDYTIKYSHLFFNIVNDTNNCGYIIFSWIKGDHDKKMRKFISSFENIRGDVKKKSDALVRFAFSYFENTFFSPSWYKSLTQKQKDEIDNKRKEQKIHNLASINSKNFNAFDISSFSYIKYEPKLVIIDTQCANLSSVKFAFERLGYNAEITNDLNKIKSADKLILPGVGTAKAAMLNLQRLGLVEVIQNLTQPVLGICLGMQLMTEFSTEGNASTLGLMSGQTELIPDTGLPLPHMGWNKVRYAEGCPLFDGIEQDSHFYFVHSYAVRPNENTIATSHYGVDFSAAIAKDNFYGVQFHPERSGKNGAMLLRNFVEKVK